MLLQPAIFFDIDFTLIDSSLLRRQLGARIAQVLKITPKKEQNLATAYARTLKSSLDFSPRRFAHFLYQKLKKPRTVSTVLKIFSHSRSLYKKAVYPDARGALKTLKKRGMRLGIFSEGDKQSQRAKLTLSGLLPSFAPRLIYLSNRKTPLFDRLPENGVVIDDNPETACALHKARPDVKIYLVKRGKWREGNYLPPAITTISSLNDLNEDKLT